MRIWETKYLWKCNYQRSKKQQPRWLSILAAGVACMFCWYTPGPPDFSCSRQCMAPGSILYAVSIATGYTTGWTLRLVAMYKSLVSYVYPLSVLIPRLLKAFGVLIPNVHTLLSKRTLNSRHHSAWKNQDQTKKPLRYSTSSSNIL